MCIRVYKGKVNALANLQSSFEEADFRIPLHVLDSLGAGHRVCVIISKDTDVIVALLYQITVVDPEKYPKHFGRSATLSTAMIHNSEHYLVKVLKRGSDIKISQISELRFSTTANAVLSTACHQPAKDSYLIFSVGFIMLKLPCTPWKVTSTLKLLSH